MALAANKPDRSQSYPDPKPGASMTAMLAARGAGAARPPTSLARPAGQEAPPANIYQPAAGGVARAPGAPIYSVTQQPWLQQLFGGGATAPQPQRTRRG
jgi:hypothetical protein